MTDNARIPCPPRDGVPLWFDGTSRGPAAGGSEGNLRVVAHKHAERLGPVGGPRDGHRAPEHAVLETVDPFETAAVEDDRVLDAALRDDGAVSDRAVGADKGALDPASLADDGRSPNRAPLHRGHAPDLHPPGDRALVADRAQDLPPGELIQ